MAPTLIERFLAKVEPPVEPLACWIWTATRGNGDYGLFWDGGTHVAHRWAYEYYVGPVPQGLQLDHLCRVRYCVNPLHLEPVTPAENTRRAVHPMRGFATGAMNRAKTHCPHGHPYDEENTYWEPVVEGRSQARHCRTCTRERMRRRRRLASHGSQ